MKVECVGDDIVFGVCVGIFFGDYVGVDEFLYY